MRVRVTTLAALVAFTALSLGCGSSSGSPTSPSTGGSGGGSSTSISIVRGAATLSTTAYSPNPDTIAAGDTIVWTNNDTEAHTSTGDNGAWNSGVIAPGATYSRTFSTAGTFTYHCTIHPGMVGTITVQ
jgi:plastocyanin